MSMQSHRYRLKSLFRGSILDFVAFAAMAEGVFCKRYAKPL